jgi:hypothetical protein
MKKFARHKTVHPSLKQQIEVIRNMPGVDRVIIGPSRGVRHHHRVGDIHVQCNFPTAVKIVGYSDRGISEFYLITSDRNMVRASLLEKFKVT